MRLLLCSDQLCRSSLQLLPLASTGIFMPWDSPLKPARLSGITWQLCRNRKTKKAPCQTNPLLVPLIGFSLCSTMKCSSRRDVLTLRGQDAAWGGNLLWAEECVLTGLVGCLYLERALNNPPNDQSASQSLRWYSSVNGGKTPSLNPSALYIILGPVW